MVLPCLLFVASFCLASARFPERAELSLAQVSVGSDGWIGPRLKGQDAAKVTEWIQQSNASEAYCKLLRHAGKCANLDCTECAENRKQEILDKVRIQILKKNQSRDPSQKPLAVFVLGAVASGKSTLIKESLEQHLDSDRSSFRSAVHINADELRSKMVGSSELYSALVNQKVSMQGSPGFRSLGSMIPDANKLRDKIQEMVLENRVDVIADSISIPVVVAKRFLEEGFQVKAFHIEVAEISDAARAKTAVGDIMRRVSRGGHLAPTYPAQIQSSRASAHKLGTEGIDISYLSRKGVKFLPAGDEDGGNKARSAKSSRVAELPLPFPSSPGRDSECHLAQDQQEREMEATLLPK
eukprot:s10674_g2.t1